MTQTNQQTPSTSTAAGQAPARGLPVPPLLAVGIVVIIYFVSMVIGEIAVSVYPSLRGWTHEQAANWLSHSTAGQFIYVIVVELLTLCLLYIFMRRRRLSWRALGLVVPRLRDIGITLLAYPPYFIVNAVCTLGAVALFNLNLDQPQQTGFEGAKSGLDLLLTFISLVLLPPIVEEIVMRGFLFGSLKCKLPVVKAAIVTSAIFALAHLQFGSGAPLLWVAAIDTFILSLVLCYLRHKTGSLWPGIGLHALKNSLAFWALFIAPHINWHLMWSR